MEFPVECQIELVSAGKSILRSITCSPIHSSSSKSKNSHKRTQLWNYWEFSVCNSGNEISLKHSVTASKLKTRTLIYYHFQSKKNRSTKYPLFHLICELSLNFLTSNTFTLLQPHTFFTFPHSHIIIWTK